MQRSTLQQCSQMLCGLVAFKGLVKGTMTTQCQAPAAQQDLSYDVLQNLGKEPFFSGLGFFFSLQAWLLSHPCIVSFLSTPHPDPPSCGA